MEIDWQAATAAGANNGVLTLHPKGAPRAWIDGTQKQSLTNIDNDTRRVHGVRLGGVSGVDTGTNGTEYIDGFVSRRATYIGLVPNDGLSLAKTEGKGGKVLAKLVAPGVGASCPAEETGITITYTYDPLDRLTAADYSNGVYFHYTYDAVGNRLTETTQLGTTTYVYDAANRLVSVNGTPYTWDNNGNLLGDGVKTYTFDHANRLKTVTGPGLAASYVYNGLGDRVSQTVNDVTTDFTLDLAAGLTQVLQDGANTYLYGNGRIGQFTATDSAYFLTDALGSVRQLVDEDGVITLAQEYEPYGEILASEGSGPSDYAFTGENFDPQTGLVFLRARYYAVYLNQFIQPDPVIPDPYNPQDWNRFVYARSNPLKYVDRDGESPECQGVPDCGLDDESQFYDYRDKYFNDPTNPLMKWPRDMHMSEEGIEFIKSWETHVYSMYNDQNQPSEPERYDRCGNGKGACTIGYGHKVHDYPCNKSVYGGREAPFENGLPEPAAVNLLKIDVAIHEKPIRDFVKVRLTQNQYDMLVDLVFTWGGDPLKRSELLKYLNIGLYVKTADTLRNTGIYAAGSNWPAPGLVRRRAAEAQKFLILPVQLDEYR